jgi:hypothetical protein
MVLKPEPTLGTRIRELDTASSEIAEELNEPFDTLSEVFPQQPPLENLHIIAKLKAGECRMARRTPYSSATDVNLLAFQTHFHTIRIFSCFITS